MATFCRKSVTPVRAEEGLTGALTTADEGVGHTGDCHAHFASKDDVIYNTTVSVSGRVCDCVCVHRCWHLMEREEQL